MKQLALEEAELKVEQEAENASSSRTPHDVFPAPMTQTHYGFLPPFLTAAFRDAYGIEQEASASAVEQSLTKEALNVGEQIVVLRISVPVGAHALTTTDGWIYTILAWLIEKQYEYQGETIDEDLIAPDTRKIADGKDSRD